MAQSSWQKFIAHWKSGGFFYAVQRGWRYLSWRSRCRRMGIDWRRFSKTGY